MPLQYFSSIHLPSAFFHFFNYIPSSFFCRHSFCMVLSVHTAKINLSPINMIYFFAIFARKQNGFFLDVQPQMPHALCHHNTSPEPTCIRQRIHFLQYPTVTPGRMSREGTSLPTEQSLQAKHHFSCCLSLVQ